MNEPVTLANLAAVAGRTQTVDIVDGRGRCGTDRKAGDVVLTGLDHDSRGAGPGTAFIAVRGATVDGHDFVATAVAQGSPVVIVERRMDVDVPQLIVERTRPLMAPLAAEVYHHPAERMKTLGVTGTNGKTTVTHMVEAVGIAAGLRTGLLGTVGTRISTRRSVTELPMVHTTPEATELQRLLHRMVEEDVDLVSLEVSSHALTIGRSDAIGFDVAAFTNLSQDHLDFHGDMESYFAAKSALFTPGRSAHAVVFIDDPWGQRLASQITIPMTAVSQCDPEADVVGTIGSLGPAGTEFGVRFPDGSVLDLRIPLGGSFNVANALVAVACANIFGIGPAAMTTGLATMAPVPGRFELITGGQDFVVVVDYAHTPDAIATVIDAVRIDPADGLAPGRIIAVGGAGGDRDHSKRPAMGAALANADIAILTSDNPRSENPADILAAMAEGVPTGASVTIEADRRRAIRSAIAVARTGDVVLILGKGHEQGQDFGSRVVPFDDRTVAAQEIAAVTGQNSGAG